ncbi:MAG: RNA chaperone Hfq [Nitrospirae bacterium]|nr:MAG: RNA chaperone Hfq [Nitrospirota bacterium]
MSKAVNLQDLFLNQLRKDKTPVTIYLTNGVRLKGVIKGFDPYVVLLKESTVSMVYKHAISTIVPEGKITLNIQEAIEELEQVT